MSRKNKANLNQFEIVQNRFDNDANQLKCWTQMRKILLLIVAISSTDRAFSIEPMAFFGPLPASSAPAYLKLPRGRWFVIVAPDLNISNWLSGSLQPLRASIALSSKVTKAQEARLIPDFKLGTLDTKSSLPLSRSQLTSPSPITNSIFPIYDQAKGTYQFVKGRLAYSSQRLQFFDELNGKTSFSKEQYQTITHLVEPRLAELQATFGTFTDFDRNEKLSVFISATAAEIHPNGEAYFDGCLFFPLGCGSKHRTEVINFWSPDKIYGTSFDLLAQEYFPRNILHESIHLAQSSFRYSLSGQFFQYWNAPAFILEGQAEWPRFQYRLGLNQKMSEINAALQAGRGPFESPYALGSLYMWWLQSHLSDRVHQVLLSALTYSSPTEDPIAKATGISEGLLNAYFFADLYQKPVIEGLRPKTPQVMSESSRPVDVQLSYTEAAVFELHLTQPKSLEFSNSSATGGWIILLPR